MVEAVEERRWFDPFVRLRHGAVELLCHTFIVTLILGAIKLTEVWTHLLFGNDPLLFNAVHLSYLFDAANLVLLAGFLIIGVPYILYAYFKGESSGH